MHKAGRKLLAAAVVAVAAAALAALLVTSPWREDGGSEVTTSSPAAIPQPPLDKLNRRTRRRLAPDTKRVDLTLPSFSHSTKITNPLFPVSKLHSVVLVGRLEGKPWRAETTLLPRTKTVDWNGRHVEALQSQFVAYLNGRIFEVAVDLYAQADDGSVWYLGEDAFSYKHGRVADTEGTWRAGVNGPPSMIMPAHPHVGDVYRTENIPGLVFEEVTVRTVGKTVHGPSGPVDGAMVARELHMDELSLEGKTFAPGYGEVLSGAGRTFEVNALTVPIDSLSGRTPAELTTLSSGAGDYSDAVRSKNWRAASATVQSMVAAWDTFRTGEVPQGLAAEVTRALAGLAQATRARKPGQASAAALDAGRAGLDLELRYRPPAGIDLGRFDLWTRQLVADAAAGDEAAAAGDVATLEWIRDRIPLDGDGAQRIDDQLRYLEAAVEAAEFELVTAAGARLHADVTRVRPKI